MMTTERELTQTDLLRLAMTHPNSTRIAQPAIQRLKQRHHEAARRIASGESLKTVAMITGYTAQRLSDLTSKDPAFMNLVSYYSGQINELTLDATVRVQSVILDVAESAVIEMQERLDDPEERRKMSMTELRQAAEFGFDRTIAPPRTAVPVATVPTKITFNIGTRDLRPKEESQPITIEGEIDDEQDK